ncbi:DUF6148 family protein [Oceanibaculum indicum]|uniref:Uncharacterized protein n=1 Tax=Oceanibaculum indicum P24 TaxID=1207063 RepID=K2K034_9PROT|nr:DUF6148 family protein [Oceanibaculum indicum]EKE70885.1 hypothetical protein P24_15119 [Oceanibaculum indicum P24]
MSAELTEAKEQLAEWKKASRALAKNQSYSIAGRTYVRSDASHVLRMLEYWKREVEQLSRRRRGIGFRKAAV